MVSALADCPLKSAYANAAISPVRLFAPPLAPLPVSSCVSASFPPRCPLLACTFREGAGLLHGEAPGGAPPPPFWSVPLNSRLRRSRGWPGPSVVKHLVEPHLRPFRARRICMTARARFSPPCGAHSGAGLVATRSPAYFPLAPADPNVRALRRLPGGTLPGVLLPSPLRTRHIPQPTVRTLPLVAHNRQVHTRAHPLSPWSHGSPFSEARSAGAHSGAPPFPRGPPVCTPLALERQVRSRAHPPVPRGFPLAHPGAHPGAK